MLSSKVSYTEMGIFSLAAYPYSLKLLWSPVVDSVYSRRVGRRKSWIVPIQLITAALLLLCSDYIQVRGVHVACAGDTLPCRTCFLCVAPC